MNTIYALASARGRAGVSVLRLSGEDSLTVLQRFVGTVPQERQLMRRKLFWDGIELDDALVVWFGKGRSFTGEQAVEFHLHGGLATVAAVIRALGHQAELRLAEPGEFTRRAFENGKLSLAEVEGLADLIDAETESQRKQAQKVLSGSIGRRVTEWRSQLIRAVSLLEATIDFADDEVPVDVRPEVLRILLALMGTLRHEIAEGTAAERLRDGYEVAIVGAPNVGKSTLLNALAGREAAITSPVAGTTRDIIEVRMDLSGLPVTILDTAGLRSGGDEVEQIGIERAVQRAELADLRIFLTVDGVVQKGPLQPKDQDIVVIGKADTFDSPEQAVSGRTGKGLDALIAEVSKRLSGKLPSDGVLTRVRHRNAVEQAVQALDQAIFGLNRSAVQVEIVVEDVRRALRALSLLVGQVDVEEFLGEIFSSFCIGK